MTLLLIRDDTKNIGEWWYSHNSSMVITIERVKERLSEQVFNYSAKN